MRSSLKVYAMQCDGLHCHDCMVLRGCCQLCARMRGNLQCKALQEETLQSFHTFASPKLESSDERGVKERMHR
jgi:hypothetical protein